MWSSEAVTVAYGLASAVAWGSGDFGGGLATKHSSARGVILFSQLIGVGLLFGLMGFMPQPAPLPIDLGYGVLAGICGSLGLVGLYTALSQGRMGVVAPVAAVVTAVIPLTVGFFLEGAPPVQQGGGFILALLAVWFLSRSSAEFNVAPRDLLLPAAAGVGFGLFFIFIDRVSTGTVLWPLIAARLGSIVIMAVWSLARRPFTAPSWRQLPLIALAGVGDTGGNAFFALAAQAGRLDIASVLSSLYPAATVLLAWLVLKERLGLKQWIGVALALVALLLIAL